MALVTYRCLCVDAVDLGSMASFWSAALGLEAEPRGDEVLLRGPTPQHAVWIESVPEAVTVKQRVHLDVRARSVDDILARGATVLDADSFPWTVLRDPEGGELCVFEREEVPDYRLYEIGIDSVEASRIATWWADVLGARVEHEERWSAVTDIAGAPFEWLVFMNVPEPKTVKNRIHWEVITEHVDLLVGDGATVLREPDEEIRWTVLADPEGNEFCAFAPDAG